jgi:LmbE family N-acetylglucosaminyl deacetylase
MAEQAGDAPDQVEATGGAPDVEAAGDARARWSRARDARTGMLLSYDPQGGYGHPDHVKVHQVGARAAQITGTRVLEATLPRELVARLFGPVRLASLAVRYDPREIRRSFTPRSAITHRVDVRRYAGRKRAALAAHRSYVRSGGRSARLARTMLALPVPVFALLSGREWFTEPGATPAAVTRDVLQAARRR